MIVPTTRRTFLSKGAAIATGVAVTSSVSFDLFAEPLVTSPGIQLYTVDKELKENVHGTLATIRSIGYRQVEGAGFAGITPKEFKKALDETGLRCDSTHFFNFGQGDPSEIFEQANTLGVHYVVSSFLGKFNHSSSGGEAGAEQYKMLADLLNQLGKGAKEAGLQLAYHNHNTEFKDLGDGKIGYDILIDSTDPNLVKLELDCGWMCAAGYDPIKYFKRYPNRYRMVHVKDFVKPAKPSHSLNRAEVPQGTVLGTGYIQYRPILVAAKAAGVEHFFVEQEPPFVGTTAIEAAKRDYEYLEGLAK